MTNTQTVPILISLVAAFLGAFAQYFYKIGAMKLDFSNIFKNYYIFGGVTCFSIVLILFIVAFRLGGKMFVIYPVYATTYIWSGLIAYYLSGENINGWQILGVGFIILGVISISFSDTLKI